MFWRRFSVIAGGPVLIGLLFLIGWNMNLFRTTDWYDIMMHLLGGGLLTLTVAGTIWHCGLRKAHHLFKPFLLVAVLCVAVAWEIFEVRFGLVPNWTRSVGDTLADILCALAGSCVMLCLIRTD